MEFDKHALNYLFTCVPTCCIAAVNAFKKIVLEAETKGKLSFELIKELEDLVYTVSFGVLLLEKYKTWLPENQKDEIDTKELVNDLRVMKSWIEDIREKLEQE